MGARKFSKEEVRTYLRNLWESKLRWFEYAADYNAIQLLGP